MARCKGCIHENVCNREVGYGYSVCPHYINSADVVPKSEYDAVVSAVDNSTNEFLKLHDDYQEQKAEIERLQHILESYALQYGTVKDQHEVIDKAKTDVAREIFEEIERLMENNEVWFRQTDEMREEFAELKKKYTKEKLCTDCKHFVGCECFDGQTCDQFAESDHKLH